jgi:hypothetical protein
MPCAGVRTRGLHLNYGVWNDPFNPQNPPTKRIIWAGWYRHSPVGDRIEFQYELTRGSGEMRAYLYWREDDGTEHTVQLGGGITGGSGIRSHNYVTEGITLADGRWVKLYVRASTTDGNTVFKIGWAAERLHNNTWPGLPTITDGQVGTAAQVNRWASALAWLKRRILIPNPGLMGPIVRSQSSVTVPLFYGHVQHVGQMLRWKVAGRVVNGNASSIRLRYNTTLLPGVLVGGGEEWDGTYEYDLTQIPGLTYGTLYPVTVEMTANPGNEIDGMVHYIFEDNVVSPSGSWFNQPTWAGGLTGDWCYGSVQGGTPPRKLGAITSDLQILYNAITGTERSVYNFTTREYRHEDYYYTNALYPKSEDRMHHVIFHRGRWFFFSDEADIQYDDQRHYLDDPQYFGYSGGYIGAFDLEGLKWLKPGVLYLVSGKNHFAAEDWES